MFNSIETLPNDVSGYQAYSASYNHFLNQAKKLFESDDVFKDSISHLTNLPTEMTDDVLENFGRLRADCVVLKSSVISFFNYYSPQEEKRQIEHIRMVNSALGIHTPQLLTPLEMLEASP